MIVANIEKKQGGGFDKLREYLEGLSGQSVEVGYFAEQGAHPSTKNTQRWSFAQLMAYHELYADENGTQLRPIFGDMVRRDSAKLRRGLLELYKKQLRGVYKRNGASTPVHTLEGSGTLIAGLIRKRFGIRSLAKNMPSTIRKKGFNSPMIETGELRDALSIKNSVTNIRKLHFKGL